MIGVYIHIPFCKKICNYCDFCKMYYDKQYTSKYLDKLEDEVNSRYKGEVISTIYIGGGTPSCLEIDELDRLFRIIDIFKREDNYEYTIECNVVDINDNLLKLFKVYGINRISIGVQSFSNEIIKKLGRDHDSQLVFNKINLVKQYFNNISIDLIYGVTEDIGIVKSDILKFIELDIPHVSCYSLIIEEHTKLYIQGNTYIDDGIDRKMFDYINDTLVRYGYKHYEISNYAKSGYESRHNKNYWLNGSYYGFGLGAVSYLDNYRISNTKNMHKYLLGEYLDRSEYEDKQIRKENSLILGLRLIDGIDINYFNKEYNDDLGNKKIIKELIDDNYLEIVNNKIRCNYEYIYLLNGILEKIIENDI